MFRWMLPPTETPYKHKSKIGLFNRAIATLSSAAENATTQAEQRLGLNTDTPRVIDPQTHTTYVLVKEDVMQAQRL